MTSRERQSLLDILIAAREAISFVEGITFDDSAKSRLIQNAVLMSLTLIGEAANRIQRSGTEELPQLPWRQMVGLRNVIVHDYEGLNLSGIWSTVENDLPRVVELLAPLFPESNPS